MFIFQWIFSVQCQYVLHEFYNLTRYFVGENGVTCTVYSMSIDIDKLDNISFKCCLLVVNQMHLNSCSAALLVSLKLNISTLQNKFLFIFQAISQQKETRYKIMSGKGKRAKGSKGKSGKQISRSQKAGLQLPVGRLSRYF